MKIVDPPLHIVLVEPQIPPNTGNIARLCAATRCHLNLVGDLGFELTNKYLKRAGLDYWNYVSWEHIPDKYEFFEHVPADQLHLLTVHTNTPYTKVSPKKGDYLFFGKETAGLPKEWLAQHPERTFTIPMWEKGVRSLNLATAVSIVLYHGLHQQNLF